MPLETVVYDVKNILLDDAGIAEVQLLARALLRTVVPTSWTTMGGAGTLAAVKKQSLQKKTTEKRQASPDATVHYEWRLVVYSEHQDKVKAVIDKLKQA